MSEYFEGMFGNGSLFRLKNIRMGYTLKWLLKALLLNQAVPIIAYLRHNDPIKISTQGCDKTTARWL